MNGEAFIAITFDFHTEILHDGDGHVHVGFGVEIGGEFDFDGGLCMGGDHQKGG